MAVRFCWPFWIYQTNGQLVWKKSPVRTNNNNICAAPPLLCSVIADGERIRMGTDHCVCWGAGVPPAWERLPIIINNNNNLARLACAAYASCGSWSRVCKTGLILEQPRLSIEWDQTREILSFHCFLSCGWRAPMDVWESFSQIREPSPLAASHTSSVSKTLVTSASFFPFVSMSLKWETVIFLPRFKKGEISCENS